MERKAGTIKLFRGHWGFIDQDRNDDIFFSRADVDRAPKHGQRVSYLTECTPKGPRAKKVKVLDASLATASDWFEFIHVRPIPRKGEDETAL